MFPGVSSQIFLKEKLDAAHAQIVRECGLDAVEAYTFPSHFDVADLAYAKDLARGFADNGVRIHSLHAPFFDSGHKSHDRGLLSISHPNPKMRQVAIDRIRQCRDTANILGAKILVIHFGGSADKNTSTVISNLFSSLVQIEDLLDGSGVRAAYENIASPVSMCGYMRHFLDKYDFRRAGICVDTGHANINEEPALAVERSGPFLLHVHASDNNGHNDSHDVPFLGSINWAHVGFLLKRMDFQGCFTFEPRTHSEPAPLLRHLKAAYEKILFLADDFEDQQPPV